MPSPAVVWRTLVIAAFVAVASLGVDSRQPAAKRATDACALLTSADVEEVLGDAIEGRKPTLHPGSELEMSQCFFATSSSRSISLMLTAENLGQRGGLTPRTYWRRQFHGRRADKEENESGSLPRHIEGIGDEAFWMGTRFAGALYVLRGQAFLRISVGGIRDEQERVEKSKALALAALRHL